MTKDDLALILTIEQTRRRTSVFIIRQFWPYILIIGTAPGCKAKYISKLYSVTLANLSRSLTNMIGRGLIRKSATKQYYLTETGQRVYNSFNHKIEKSIGEYRRATLQRLNRPQQ